MPKQENLTRKLFERFLGSYLFGGRVVNLNLGAFFQRNFLFYLIFTFRTNRAFFRS